MITKPKKKTKKLSKNFSFKQVHMDFFKECVSDRAGSHFIQKLIENSVAWADWNLKKVLKEREG